MFKTFCSKLAVWYDKIVRQCQIISKVCSQKSLAFILEQISHHLSILDFSRREVKSCQETAIVHALCSQDLRYRTWIYIWNLVFVQVTLALYLLCITRIWYLNSWCSKLQNKLPTYYFIKWNRGHLWGYIIS